MKLLSYDDLKPAKGVAYSKIQLWRLEKQGSFPKRIPLGKQRYGWAEHEIDAWIAERIHARDHLTKISPRRHPATRVATERRAKHEDSRGKKQKIGPRSHSGDRSPSQQQ